MHAHRASSGRPNVGKSRLLNALLGQERVIVSDMPGTTRDAIDTALIVRRRRRGAATCTLIDTAGIRRRGHIESGVEKYSVIRTLRAITRADVVLLLIDATEGITAQDTHIAGYVLEQFKSMVLLVNKWDLVEKDSNTLSRVHREAARGAELHALCVRSCSSRPSSASAPTRCLPTALAVAAERTRRIPTGPLNKLVKEATDAHPPPSKPGKWVKFLYATQAETSPPTFVFFVNDAEAVHFSYKRYLENQLREAFGFEGTPDPPDLPHPPRRRSCVTAATHSKVWGAPEGRPRCFHRLCAQELCCWKLCKSASRRAAITALRKLAFTLRLRRTRSAASSGSATRRSATKAAKSRSRAMAMRLISSATLAPPPVATTMARTACRSILPRQEVRGELARIGGRLQAPVGRRQGAVVPACFRVGLRHEVADGGAFAL